MAEPPKRRRSIPKLSRQRQNKMRFGLVLVFILAMIGIARPATTKPAFVPSLLLGSTLRSPIKFAASSSNHHQDSSTTSRRSVFQKAIIIILSSTFVPQLSWAEDNGQAIAPKPYAPLEALLPATRVKLLIDRAAQLAFKLVNNDNNENEKQAVVQELQVLLLKPQNFTRSSLADVPKQPARQYLDSYKRNRQSLPWLEKPGALLVESGEIDTWKRLKRQERLKESNDEVRAALNMYTSNLSFDANKYTLTAPKEERSKLIRQDQLPDVKTVITSDMGMRYLYRNQVLTAMEDVRAEMQYQLEQDSFDGTELQNLLQEAQKACERWFSLIDEGDICDALNVAKKEMNERS